MVPSRITRHIVFRHEAETELAEAVDWYEARSQGLGAEFLRSLDAVIAHMQRHPTLYPIVFGGARCCGGSLQCDLRRSRQRIPHRRVCPQQT